MYNQRRESRAGAPAQVGNRGGSSSHTFSAECGGDFEKSAAGFQPSFHLENHNHTSLQLFVLVPALSPASTALEGRAFFPRLNGESGRRDSNLTSGVRSVSTIWAAARSRGFAVLSENRNAGTIPYIGGRAIRQRGARRMQAPPKTRIRNQKFFDQIEDRLLSPPGWNKEFNVQGISRQCNQP